MDELKDMIALLKRADFDPAEIDTDLHKRVAAAVKDGFIKRFDMRTSSRDGDQDLSMWLRDVEEVVREVMCDERLMVTSTYISKLVWTMTRGSVCLAERQMKGSRSK